MSQACMCDHCRAAPIKPTQIGPYDFCDKCVAKFHVWATKSSGRHKNKGRQSRWSLAEVHEIIAKHGVVNQKLLEAIRIGPPRAAYYHLHNLERQRLLDRSGYSGDFVLPQSRAAE